MTDNGEYRVYRFTIANVELDTVARLFASARVPATLSTGVGVSGWGVEQTVTIESAVPDTTQATEERDLFDLVCGLLADHDEICAYFTRDGANPRLVYAGGRVETLAGVADHQPLDS
jgi:hypothetical protein